MANNYGYNRRMVSFNDDEPSNTPRQNAARASYRSDYAGYEDAYERNYGRPSSYEDSYERSYGRPSSREDSYAGGYDSPYSHDDASTYRASSYRSSSRGQADSGQRYRSSQRQRQSDERRSAERSSTRQSGYSTRRQESASAGARSRQAPSASRRSMQAGRSRAYSDSAGYGSGYGGSGYGSGSGKGPGSGIGSFLTPQRIIIAVAAIILIILLFNLVTCAVKGGGDSKQSSAASSAATQVTQTSSGAAASSASSASTTPASTEGVEDPWVEGGRFTTGDAELDKMVKQFCDDNSNKDLSASENAFNVYCAVVWGEYIESDDNQEPLGPNWDIEYAKQYITAGGGNCYNFCAFNEYVLKYFGYSDAVAEPCIVLRQSGDYGDHGLVFVTNIENGKRCLCDSAFGSDGWMVDINEYTMQVRNIGQDPSEFNVAPFEGVSEAPWYNGTAA